MRNIVLINIVIGSSGTKYLKMHMLMAKDHMYITENILKAFNQNRITTLLDFLQENVEKLSTLSKLTLPQILEIRNNILAKYSAQLVNGTSLLISSLTCKRFIETGIDSLDGILNNGIPVGFLTEICGLAGCGKSQLCMQLSINCVKTTNNTVLYIDTKGDFSALRIQKILDGCAFSHKDMAGIMFKIKIVYLWRMEDLIKLFDELKCGHLVIDNLKLIIIDSLPSLMFQHFGDDNKIGLKLINKFVNYARYISREMEIGFVCVNIQTRWIDQDTMDLEDNEQSSTTTKETTYTEKWNRCLGNYWQNIPLIVLFLEKYKNNNTKHCSMIKIKVSEYNNPQTDKSCMLEISPCGVG